MIKELTLNEYKNVQGGAIQMSFGPAFWLGFSLYKTHTYLEESGTYESFGEWSHNDGIFRTSQKL